MYSIIEINITLYNQKCLFAGISNRISEMYSKTNKILQNVTDGHGFWVISMLDPKGNARIDITMRSLNHLQQILELKSITAGLT